MHRAISEINFAVSSYPGSPPLIVVQTSLNLVFPMMFISNQCLDLSSFVGPVPDGIRDNKKLLISLILDKKDNIKTPNINIEAENRDLCSVYKLKLK